MIEFKINPSHAVKTVIPSDIAFPVGRLIRTVKYDPPLHIDGRNELVKVEYQSDGKAVLRNGSGEILQIVRYTEERAE